MSQIKIKRGLRENLPSSLPLGEPAVCIDTCELYIGTGIGKPLIKIGSKDLTEVLSLISSVAESKVSHSDLDQLKAQLDSITTDNADGNKDSELVALRTDTKGETHLSANARIDALERKLLDALARIEKMEKTPIILMY